MKTADEWANYWLEAYKEPSVSWKIYQDYKMYVEKQIIPAIGRLKLSDVRPANIAKIHGAAKNKKGKPLSRSALNMVKISLNGIFDTGIGNSPYTKNPAKKVSLPDKEPTQVSAFTKNKWVA